MFWFTHPERGQSVSGSHGRRLEVKKGGEGTGDRRREGWIGTWTSTAIKRLGVVMDSEPPDVKQIASNAKPRSPSTQQTNNHNSTLLHSFHLSRISCRVLIWRSIICSAGPPIARLFSTLASKSNTLYTSSVNLSLSPL